jgi:hypothetical protein
MADATASKPETWTRWVALSMAIMAVMAGVITLYMGKFSGKAVMLQGKITNQWGYYQAKSIKQHTYEMQRQQLELATLERGATWTEEIRSNYTAAVAYSKKMLGKYEKEKDEIKADGEKMEKQRDDAQARGGKLSLSLIFAQIAIMLSSVTLITKKKPLWFCGMALMLVSLWYVGVAFGVL